MSDLEVKPIVKFFRVTVSSIKYPKNTNTAFISLYVYNNSPNKITLLSGLIRYCETNSTFHTKQEKAFRVHNFLVVLVTCQSTVLNDELFVNNITNFSKITRIFFHKIPYFKPTFQMSKYTNEQQNF